MLTNSRIELEAQIPDSAAIGLTPLIKRDQYTREGKLGDHQSPTARVFYEYSEIEEILEVGLDTQIPPTFSARYDLQNINFQLLHHPYSMSLFWVGSAESLADQSLPVEQAQVTIEVERNRIHRTSDHFGPTHLRIGVFDSELNRPIGIAWSLSDDKNFRKIFQVDIPPTTKEYHLGDPGVGSMSEAAERIPTETHAYVRTFSAAFITEAMIPNFGGGPEYKGVFKFGGYYRFDASWLAHYGFYAVKDESNMVIGFQGGNNEFLKGLKGREVLQRPLPSWHLSIPNSLGKI